MQEVIRTEFRHCTVITIAHRLDSLLDFDTVAVLDKGQLCEVSSPRMLLSSAGSVCAKMNNTGPSNGSASEM